jgi:hypothetical protein
LNAADGEAAKGRRIVFQRETDGVIGEAGVARDLIDHLAGLGALRQRRRRKCQQPGKNQ